MVGLDVLGFGCLECVMFGYLFLDILYYFCMLVLIIWLKKKYFDIYMFEDIILIDILLLVMFIY